jgi:hypothetical protein
MGAIRREVGDEGPAQGKENGDEGRYPQGYP